MSAGWSREESLLRLQRQLGHVFSDPALVEQALTHASHPDGQSRSSYPTHYERLEFLGDRVVNLAVAHLLWQRFPQDPEGDLAKKHAWLVSQPTLAQLARNLHIAESIRLSYGEETMGGRQNEAILADVFEALMAAFYLDAKEEVCLRFLQDMFSVLLDDIPTIKTDPKTRLQEWLQMKGYDLPIYEISDRTGPDHAPEFIIKLSVATLGHAYGQGKSRKKAEFSAAEHFWQEVVHPLQQESGA